MKTNNSMTSNFVSVILSIVVSVALPSICAAGETCPSNGSGPDICVSWQTGTPDIFIDFTVDYATDASNPIVTLKTGDLYWNVRSKNSDDTPGNIGSLLLNPSVSSDDFEVTILNGAAAGAANVASIDLTAESWTGFSSIKDGHITGDLTTELTVVQDSGGVGGEVTLIVEGDVSGAMTIPVLKGLTIDGDLLANIDVTVKLDGGDLLVKGSVVSPAPEVRTKITIADIVPPGGGAVSEIKFNSDDSAGDSFDGELVLENGVPDDVSVFLFGESLSGNAVVDLNGGGVAISGELRLGDSNDVDIIDGGEVAGVVELAHDSCPGTAVYSGTATFASGSNGGMEGQIRTVCADLGGSVIVTGNMGATLHFNGDILVDGKVLIGGNLTADLTVFGDILGEVDIDGDVSGNIIVERIAGTDGAGDGLLTVGGDLSSVVTQVLQVTDEIATGTLMIDGSVGATTTITIADMVTAAGQSNGSFVWFNQSGDEGPEFAGDLILTNGIPADQQVYILEHLTGTASVDLTTDPLGANGFLIIDSAASGATVDGGTLSGRIRLAHDPSHSFDGTATFTSVASTGEIVTVSVGNVGGTINITGAMAGLIWILGDFSSGGLIDIDSDLSGEIRVQAAFEGDVTVGGSVTSVGEFDINSGFVGDIAITTDLAGDIDIDGDVTSLGTIDIGGNFESTGLIRIGGKCAGDISVAGKFEGDLGITGSLTSTGSITASAGSDGDISVGSNLAGAVTIAGALSTTGRVLVDGLISGSVDIALDTATGSLIQAIEGLDTGGTIEINTSQGDYDAHGAIVIGESTSPLPDVTFDGCIRVYDEDAVGNTGDYGNLEGVIAIGGCHASAADAEICIDGDINGTIGFRQAGCTYQVTNSCTAGCP